MRPNRCAAASVRYVIIRDTYSLLLTSMLGGMFASNPAAADSRRLH